MKIFLIAVIFLGLGFGIGFEVAIFLFAIDVDMLSIPYQNTGVITTRSLVIKQHDIHVHIPKGTQLTFVRHIPQGEIYSLQFYTDWSDHHFTERLERKPRYFVVKEMAK